MDRAAAAGLETPCRSHPLQRMPEVEALGVALTNWDPLALELLALQAGGPALGAP